MEKESQSIRVAPTMPANFNVPSGHLPLSEQSCFNQLAFVHPLKESEANYEKHQHNLKMNMLRISEGIHAPLKINMELSAARKIGRLPFLPSSNLMEDSLTGKLDEIDFTDILGSEEFSEFINQPHAVVEKSLGIL